jgi:hypothetical protein
MPHVATPNQNELAKLTFQLLLTRTIKESLLETPWEQKITIQGDIACAEEQKNTIIYEANIIALTANKYNSAQLYLPKLPKSPIKDFLVLNKVNVAINDKTFRVYMGYSVGYQQESTDPVIVIGDCLSSVHYERNNVRVILTAKQQEEFLPSTIDWVKQLLESLQVNLDSAV